MGSCSSVHCSSFGSKSDKLVIPPPPIKEKPKNGSFRIDDVAVNKSQWSPPRSTTTTFADYGSKEEVFFDSKPWLDSDSEDDFCSVKGEFTPSHGNTPIHPTFGTPVVNKTHSEKKIPGSVGEPSSNEKRKKLLELFRESVRGDQDGGHVENTSVNGNIEVKPNIIHDLASKSACSAPYISRANSACNSARTMNEEEHIPIRSKSVKSAEWCLPSLASCRSFSEKRRKRNPVIAANGKY